MEDRPDKPVRDGGWTPGRTEPRAEGGAAGSSANDAPTRRPGARVAPPPAPPKIVWAMAFVFVAFEAAFQLSEIGVLPWPDLRWDVVSRLGFFDLYFNAALSGADAPPPEFWTSFLTYGFLHGGLLHLAMNTAVFLGLGGMLAHALGPVRFVVLFLATSAAGALVWGLLYSSDQTLAHLVGASGALFGFIGALKRWEWRWIAATGASSRRFWGTLLALALLNILLGFAVPPGGGGIAWQAHLGGFIGGWLLAPLLAPGRAGPSPI